MSGPNPLLKAKNFTLAAIKHLVNGSPTCDQAEINRRLDICKACSYFNGKTCTDNRCGCNINDQKIYLNKLAWADQSCPRDKWGTPIKDMVTFCITTFKRPTALEALQASIKKFYPDVKQVVVDTRGNLSWGRNYAIKQCLTPYIMILEDDFVFTENTNLYAMVSILQEDEELGGIGGQVGGSVAAYDFDCFRWKLYSQPATRFKTNKFDQHYVLVDYMDNFGLFRRDMFVDHQWDEELEIHEHMNFFYNVWRGEKWRLAVAKDIKIKHERPRPTPEYKQYRKRNFVKQAQKKLGVDFQPITEAFQWDSFDLQSPQSKD